MGLDRSTVYGREAELSALDSALADVNPQHHVLAVVRGPRGIGKSGLLAAFARRRPRDVRVLTVAFRGAVQPWDEFGAGALLATAQDHFEDFADAHVAASIEAVRQLLQPVTYQSSRGRSSLLVELARLFCRLTNQHKIVLFADDVDALAAPALALATVCLPGCLVVATCVDDGEHAQVLTELCYLADHVVEVGPLPTECVATLLAKATGAALDEAALSRVLTALGPLSRHPATLLATVDDLQQAGRLAVVRGRTCLRDDDPVLLPAGHAVLARLSAFGSVGHHLAAMAAAPVKFSIDDLPTLVAAVGGTVTEYGNAIDQLVRLNVLHCGVDGRLTCTCSALAGRVLADADAATRSLHRAVAEHLLVDSVDDTAVAEHLALAGTALPPSPRHAAILVAHAERVADSDADRAARWYLAALHHTESDQQRPIITELARLLSRTGRYQALVDILACQPLDDQPLDEELVAAVTVAAVHARSPLPEAILGALPSACQRWLAGDPMTPVALLAWCAPLGKQGTHREELSEAAGLGDIAAMLRVTANGQTAMPTSVPDLYHRVLRGYHSGDWPSALSCARRLELLAPRDTTMITVARLLAAEVCSAQGDMRQALAWSAAAGTDGRLSAMRAWVESGMRWRLGDPAAAFELGWRGYVDSPSEQTSPGRAWLLARLVVITARHGVQREAAMVLDEIEDHCRQTRTRASRQLLLLGRGAVQHDLAAIRGAAEIARRRGHLPDLLGVCLLAGELAAEPRPWLHEAHDIVARLDAPPLRGRTRDLMRLRGVAAPRAADKAATLSKTELRIAAMIRNGRTNRQIAVAMQMSEKNVEYYLSRLFTKTGARTRVAVAAAMVKGRLDAISA